MSGRLTVALALAVMGGCTSQPTILPSRDLDRPEDVTFVCLGAFTPGGATDTDGGAADAQAPAGDGATTTELKLTGRPMRECHPRNRPDPPLSPANRTFAFMPQSSSGQLAVVDADTWKLLDLDPANAGFNQAPLGVLPSQITTSDDGCRMVTANHGSCDLTLVDPAALLAPTFARQYPGVPATTGNPVTRTIQPHAKGGPNLDVFPGEVAFIPHPTAAGQNLCPDDWNWRALVTFPSCDLIALVDLANGEIVDGAYVRQTSAGFALEPLGGRAPVCAARDCTYDPQAADGGAVTTDAAGEGGADAGAADGGATDAGADEAGTADAGAAEAGAPPPVVVASPVPPLRPGPIAIVPESGRSYVGLGNGDVIVAFDATKDSLSGWSTIQLHERPLGVSRLRLSIDPYADKTAGTQGMIPGRFIGDNPDRQYLYAVARDGSVRIVQVAHAPGERECESNIDPLNLPAGATLQDACIDVDPSHRRPTAQGPGVRTPSPPIDVAVADISPTPQDQSESTVEGAHAWVLTASGNIYLINIDPVRRLTSYVENDGTVLACTNPPDMCHPEDPPQPNVLRNRNVASFQLSLDPTAGPARVDLNPSATVVGPHIEPVWTRGTAQNATAQTPLYQQTPIFFPDPTAVNQQAWAVTWEGALIATPRLSGHVLGISPDTTGLADPVPQLYDPGSDFCRLGVQPRDLVTLAGCTNDTQCGLGKVCAHGTEGTQGAGGLAIGGLCLPASGMVAGGTTDDKCAALLGTVRRYEVTKARPNTLLLTPHMDELVKPDLRPCTGGAAVAGDGGAGVDGGADAGDAGAQDGGTTDALGDGGDTGGGPADGGDAGTKGMGCGDPADPSTSGFQCFDGRCLDECTEPGKATGCRAGRICINFKTPDTPSTGPCGPGDCFCADGPDLRDTTVNAVACIGELLGYQVNVGRGFLVSGGATGVPVTETAVTDKDSMNQSVCAPVANGDPRNAMRISMDAPLCKDADMFDPTLDSRCNPDAPDSCPLTPAQRAALPDPMDPSYAAKWRDLVSPIPQKLLAIARDTAGPNPCLFNGGPNASDPSSISPPSHVHALFRNQEVQFMMTNLEQAPTGTYQIRFDVQGGFKPQYVIIPPTVEVTMPVRLFLGPVDSLPQSGENYVGEVPYLFVVDQRRLGRTQGGGPTRGQLLRIHPLGYQVPTPKGLQPWYEDFAHSGDTFPIQ